MKENLAQIEEAARALKSRVSDFPKLLLTLGSGLNPLVQAMQVEREFSYSEIPHFKTSSVQGHSGKFVVGTLHGVRLGVMQGRVHYYEGHSLFDVVLPFRAIALAGADKFVLTNAAGGLHPDLQPPSIMLVRDHINLMGADPLRGANLESLGPRFPALNEVYDHRMSEVLIESAKQAAVTLRQGVYVALSGPSYETPAEVKMYRTLGADVTGMSTVPEAIALVHMGRRVAALSCVTNLAAGLTDEPPSHEEVIQNAGLALTLFDRLFAKALRQLEAN